VSICVRMIAYSPRTGKPISTKLDMLTPQDQKEIPVRSRPESVLSASPSKGGFYSSETKHDRRTASGPKLFVSKKRLQGRGHSPGNLSWVRVPVKMVSVAVLGSSHGEDAVFRINFFL
jgi:hypothetical protein